MSTDSTANICISMQKGFPLTDNSVRENKIFHKRKYFPSEENPFSVKGNFFR